MDPSENIYCTNSCNLNWMSVCVYMPPPPPETWAPVSLNVRLCLPMTWHTTQQQWRNWHRGTINENYRVWPQRIYYVMVLFTEHVLYHEAFLWDYQSRCLGVPRISAAKESLGGVRLVRERLCLLTSCSSCSSVQSVLVMVQSGSCSGGLTEDTVDGLEGGRGSDSLSSNLESDRTFFS